MKNWRDNRLRLRLCAVTGMKFSVSLLLSPLLLSPLLLAVFLLFAAPLWLFAAERSLILGDFKNDFAEWSERSFAGNTQYEIVTLDGEEVLQARANNTASALYRQVRIDLSTTPILQWRWRIDNTFGTEIDEQSKAGDDYPARVYVVKRGGLAFWRTKTINYVWSSSGATGQRWDNAYAGRNAHMWALNSGADEQGVWIAHSRDIRADWLTAFGEEIDSLDGIAVMTDADDSDGSVRAWYDGLRFVATGLTRP